MMLIFCLFVGGMILSAFFSGSETGFYRMNRARLLIRALDGDWISRGLLWLAGNPAVFVATALIGNNVANYTLSLSIVMATEIIAQGWSTAELLMPMLFAPFIFVYGELFPKNISLAAPNRLLRRCGPFFAVAILLFSPISLLLWLLNKLIELVGRKSPEELRMVLARRELGELLHEGQAVGLLRATQQTLAQSTLTLAPQPVANFMVPVSRFPRITRRMTPKDVAHAARRSQRWLLPVEEYDQGRRSTVGYVQASDCLLTASDILPLRPTIEVRERQPYLTTLAQMQAADVALATVVNRRGQTVGYVTLVDLRDALLAE